jgi:thioredoxin-related protein
MKTSLLILLTLATVAFAAPPTPGPDLRKTLSAAAQQQKLAFVLLGRPTCGNCNATKAMIQAGKIPVTDAEYVMADLNIDDPKTEGEFMRKYGKEKFGETLPFIVVTDSKGKALASSGGYKTADQWKALLTTAKATAAAKPASGAAPTSDWPFKPTTPQ